MLRYSPVYQILAIKNMSLGFGKIISGSNRACALSMGSRDSLCAHDGIGLPLGWSSESLSSESSFIGDISYELGNFECDPRNGSIGIVSIICSTRRCSSRRYVEGFDF